MKKIFAAALVLAGAFLFASPAAVSSTTNPFTTVTATVTDPNGIPYGNGTMSAVLVPGSPGGWTLNNNGVVLPYSGQINTVQLDSNGHFSANFGNNSQILPAGSAWLITVNSNQGGIPGPFGTGPQTFSVTIAITGGTVDISATLNAAARKLTNFASLGTVTTTGSPAANEFAIFSGPSSIGPASPCALLQPTANPTAGQVLDSAAPSGGTCQTNWISISGSGSIPGTPGLNAVPVQSGLMAEYRMLPTETPGALVDYSGNGNNATGTVGTAPTMIANTGGVLFPGTGAVNLPAALNSALTIQLFFIPGSGNGGSLIAGNGAAANMILLSPTRVGGTNDSIITGYASEHNLRYVAGNVDTAPPNGVGPYPRAAIGTGSYASIAWDMVSASNDLFYINGTAANSYILEGLGTGAGHQTSGNYQLGGIASASCTNWAAQLCNFASNGTQIYYAIFYNRALTATEIQENTVFVNNMLNARAVNQSPYKPIDINSSSEPTLAVDGDSLSCGPCAGVTPLPANSYTGYLFGLNTTFSVTNQALGGRTLNGNMVPAGGQAIDPLFYPYSYGNVAICAFCGTNDNVLGVIQGGMVQWAQNRHAVGWKTIVAGILDGHGDAIKNSLNTWLRQNWRLFADAFVDVAGTSQLGANGAQNNTTDFYTTDKLHIQDNGIINYEAPYIKRAINRLYGNQDFSSATVYVAAALAPTATVSGTSSATQNVITVAATPANCIAGSWVTVAGVTPAGYNGNFYLTSVTGTTVTMHNAPSESSLANISVQGTIACPQQQDADAYQVLNFGAGNYTLQTAVGYTGQNINIFNTNAAASTLVPFSSETINGVSTWSLPGGGTICLTSVLISPAAGGNNWQTCDDNAAGAVTAVTASAPIVSSGGSTPAISCPTCQTSGGTGTVTAVDKVTQSAAIGTTSILTCPASPVTGTNYLLSWNAKVTTAATATSSLGPLQITYTTPDGTTFTAQNINYTIWPAGTAIDNAANGSNVLTSYSQGMPFLVNCEAGATISYAFGYASTGLTAMVYDLHIRLLQQ
jgi:hypothetical protein